jgi:hypothetical protein
MRSKAAVTPISLLKNIQPYKNCDQRLINVIKKENPLKAK